MLGWKGRLLRRYLSRGLRGLVRRHSVKVVYILLIRRKKRLEGRPRIYPRLEVLARVVGKEPYYRRATERLLIVVYKV